MAAMLMMTGCQANAQTSGLPLITIQAETELNAQKKVTAHMEMEGYNGAIGIKLRGNSSLSFNQKKYTFETRDENGKEQDVSLLGMPAHSDWVLLAPYNDVSMVRDPLAFQLWREMGHWGPRTQMVEVVFNGDYRGIYILCEAIKRGEERVDVSKLKKSDVKGRDVTGGYILRIDTYNDDDATFASKVPGVGPGIMTSQITWSCIYPKKKNLQPEQMAYIQNYVDTMEAVIQGADFADPQKGYARYIDVPSFVDYFIHTELSLNADGYKRSAYFYKEKMHEDGTGGKIHAGPVWDYNLAYGNNSFCSSNQFEDWCFEGCNTQPTPAFWQRLLQDPAFRKAVKVRYQELRKNVLSTKNLYAIIDKQAKLLQKAKDHHFQTYPELLVDKNQQQSNRAQSPMGGQQHMNSHQPMNGTQPPMGGFGGGFGGFGGGGFGGGFGMFAGRNFNFDPLAMFTAYRVSSYEEGITILKHWFADRLAFLDKNIDRFDSDWEPRIQELKEIQMQFGNGFPFGGGGPNPFGSGGSSSFGSGGRAPFPGGGAPFPFGGF